MEGGEGSRPPRNPDDIFARARRPGQPGRSPDEIFARVGRQRRPGAPDAAAPPSPDIPPPPNPDTENKGKGIRGWLSEKKDALKNNPVANRIKNAPQFVKDSFWRKEDARFTLGTGAAIGLLRAGMVAGTGGLDIWMSAGVGAVAGAVRAAGREIYREFDAQNKSALERVEQAASEGRTADIADIRKRNEARDLRFRDTWQRYQALDNKKRVWSAAVRGGIYGAIGGAVGFEIKELGVVDKVMGIAAEHTGAAVGFLAGGAAESWKQFRKSDNQSALKTARVIFQSALLGAGVGEVLDYALPDDLGAGLIGGAVKPELTPGASPSTIPVTPETAPSSPTTGPTQVRPDATPTRPIESAPKPATPTAVPKPPAPTPEAPKPTLIPAKPLKPTSFLPIEPGVLASVNDQNVVGAAEISAPILYKSAISTGLEIRQVPLDADVYQRITEGIDSDSLRLNSSFMDRFNEDLNTNGDTILRTPNVRDIVNSRPSEILSLTEPDLRSAVGSEWSSLSGKVQGWIGEDFFTERDPRVLAEIEEIIKAEQANLKPGEGVFFGDENPGTSDDQKFWNLFKSGQITKFDPYNENHARVLRMMKNLPKGSAGRELYDRQFLGAYAKFKLDNPEDPGNIGAIFNKGNSDYFKHEVDFKIAQSGGVADLRKAA